jgi:hypothetical protein
MRKEERLRYAFEKLFQLFNVVVSLTSTFTAILIDTPTILNFACQKQKLPFIAVEEFRLLQYRLNSDAHI